MYGCSLLTSVLCGVGGVTPRPIYRGREPQ